MKKLLQSIYGNRTSLLRSVGRRSYSAESSEMYRKRNYANNISEYWLLRDVYDDLTLDGVRPSRDFFHSLVVGTMKGARMQDALFFRDEMKAMGLPPDVAVYNFLISTCGKCKMSEHAVHIFEEMKRNEVKPTGETYICLLNAFAATGRLDQVYAIVRDMTAAGLGLNKYCYAGLITVHRNKTPLLDDTAGKIIELVEQSKGWSSVQAPGAVAENVMAGVSEEELYNIPTAPYLYRRGGFVTRALTVYHVAFHALADLQNVEAIETLLQMLAKENKGQDVFITIQIMRGYLNAGMLDRGLKVFQDYMSASKPPMIELYVTLVEGAMINYTPEGMKIAQDTLVAMTQRNLVLTARMGSDLLRIAAGEKTGGYTTANYLWDLMQSRRLTPTFPAVDAYFKGLKEREIPEDDPRLIYVSRVRDKFISRFGGSIQNQREVEAI
ncbi:Pentatricopeptide repeat-containing protein [Drosera capensis]